VTADDHQLAADLAERAGELLLAVREELGVGHAELNDQGDKRSNELLLAGLAEARPHDKVLSEESPDDPSRVGAERVWIIDPLDGTREFSEGRSDWAVHVALWQGGSLVAGAVALPGLGEVHRTQPPSSRPAVPERPVRVVVSRTRPPAWAGHLADALGGELVPMGSAGAKVMAVLRGEVDVYAHAGGQWEWDSAAPVVVADAAGLHTSRIDGSPLVYNQPRPWLPDLLVCPTALVAPVRDVLGGLDLEG
jgi:3'(2'), 5'-bisphosphate nucleotidase